MFWSGNPRGSALIVAMAIIILLAGLSAALLSTIHTRALHSQVDLEDVKAFEAAEAGLDAAINDVNRQPMEQVSLGTSPVQQAAARASCPSFFFNNITQGSPAVTADIPFKNVYDHIWTCVLNDPRGVLNSTGSAPTGAQDLTQYFYEGPSGTNTPYQWVFVNPPPNQNTTTIVSEPNIPRYNSPGCLGTEFWIPGVVNQQTQTLSAVNDDTLHPTVIPADYVSRPRWPSVQTNTDGSAATPEKRIFPIQLADVYFFTYTVPWLHNGIDDNGDGNVDDITERGKYTVYSTGICKGLAHAGVTTEGKVVTVEAVIEALDPAPLPPLPGALIFQ